MSSVGLLHISTSIDLNIDLLHLYEFTKQQIDQIQKNYNIKKELILSKLHEILINERPYGATPEQEQILKKAIHIFEINLLSYNSPLSTQLTYRQYKELINEISYWIKQEYDQLLFLPSFLLEVKPIIEEYKDFISKPITKSFCSSSDLPSKDMDPLKIGQDFVDRYLRILELYFNTETIDTILTLAKASSESFQTTSSNRPKPLIGLRGNSRGLLGSEMQLMQREDMEHNQTHSDEDEERSEVFNGLNFQDLGRVNLNQKYKYEKRCHFRDTIQQYQGLQNKYIPDSVFEDVDQMIKAHGLYMETQKDPYQKITKEHIRRFLTETQNSKFYEDLQLIYSKITGRPCPNISKYEAKLYEEFDMLVEAFLSMKSQRKNFLNSHYVLRQLLRRQGQKISEEELNCLKTPSRLREHDEIYQKCCEKLNWNFTPLS